MAGVGTAPTYRDVRDLVAIGSKADARRTSDFVRS